MCVIYVVREGRGRSGSTAIFLVMKWPRGAE